MFGLESCHRHFVCQHPVSMNKGIDALFSLITCESPLSPMTGDVFVFFSKNRQAVKLLRWDTDGFLLYQKRLERITTLANAFDGNSSCCTRSALSGARSRCQRRIPSRATTSSRGRPLAS